MSIEDNNKIKLTYEDIKPYEKLFSIAPSLLLKTMINRNSNVVIKFKSQIIPYINNLNSKQTEQLNLIFESEITELQELLMETYEKTGKKQFKLLADSNSKKFIELNLKELKILYESI